MFDLKRIGEGWFVSPAQFLAKGEDLVQLGFSISVLLGIEVKNTRWSRSREKICLETNRKTLSEAVAYFKTAS